MAKTKEIDKIKELNSSLKEAIKIINKQRKIIIKQRNELLKFSLNSFCCL
jgi:hypothetical protein